MVLTLSSTGATVQINELVGPGPAASRLRRSFDQDRDGDLSAAEAETMAVFVAQSATRHLELSAPYDRAYQRLSAPEGPVQSGREVSVDLGLEVRLPEGSPRVLRLADRRADEGDIGVIVRPGPDVQILKSSQGRLGTDGVLRGIHLDGGEPLQLRWKDQAQP